MSLSIVKKQSNIVAAGLALFSMFFGAGDLIWPLILGGNSGDKNFFAMVGLIFTGVSLPLLGLISMMLFEGNYRAFFERIGKVPGVILIFIIQAILGPIGSIPRLATLSYATLKPYLPEFMNFTFFTLAAGILVLVFTVKKRRIIDLLGLLLTPVLLGSLGMILFLGFQNPPPAAASPLSPSEAFSEGLRVGYNTLDLIASFIFAPFVMSHFIGMDYGQDPLMARREVFKQMVKASLLAAGLLSVMYVGLTYVAAFYTPILEAGHAPEERLSAIAMYLLGSKGAFVACLAVAMACLTTAIPLVSICGEYIKKDLLKGRGGEILPLVITLLISGVIANLGFTGIANMLSPILVVLCPGLIVLSVLNIIYKLYDKAWTNTPVFAAFGISMCSYLYERITM
ncbi:branched-chain amino acid transport system II carrier protein [Parachlamydia sp. AcF125]|uniref:branched-chain amino acid transport system II carrier protein n=1 Tax=Parachlamydia sp. AcF125 TaxID=2795736 RepID=UPI001BC8FDA3|nr:branched-chain amino acid transport system II carrier protein [Parachlamydia sp. AcF125]MBS4169172.1 Branched-chain amino acid transport system 2 carrier protein [Parachlamydia sp. AcF125]